jgi:hypothetical protein
VPRILDPPALGLVPAFTHGNRSDDMSIHSDRILALQRLHILSADRADAVAQNSDVSVGVSIMSLIDCCSDLS